MNYFKDEIKKKKTLQLEDKTDMEKQVLYQLQKDFNFPNCLFILNVLTIQISREAYPVSAMVCFKNGFRAKKITGILM